MLFGSIIFQKQWCLNAITAFCTEGMGKRQGREGKRREQKNVRDGKHVKTGKQLVLMLELLERERV